MNNEPISRINTWSSRKPVKKPKNSAIPHAGVIPVGRVVITAPAMLRTE
ncbi:MAG: hypothetical protein J6A41_08200 [Ruminiclostridium sp.]|nr:hypothetical protein [Ruminiclostridium sp.]